MIFEEAELRQVLAYCERTPLHTDVFAATPDGAEEMVVVNSKLHSYFVVASQTCDICGEDKPARPATIILPFLTWRELCRYQRLPMFPDMVEMTIEQFLEEFAKARHLKFEHDDFAYPALLKKILSEWDPPEKDLKTKRGRIRNLLNNQGDWMYKMHADINRSIPEGYVDFSVAHNVPTLRLNQLTANRRAVLNEPFRTHFAKAFADRFARIALPAIEKKEGF